MGSSDSGSSSSDTSSSASATPEPIASIASLTGVDTEVTVDAGFLDALTSLGLTPGVVGTATLTDGVLAFPITGGNVDYYDPEQSYRPFVQGSIEHEGSGFSLTAGSTVGQSNNLCDSATQPVPNGTANIASPRIFAGLAAPTSDPPDPA